MAVGGGCIFVCVCSHTEALECYFCQTSAIFYETDQTQGVIVIYEAPCCLWRVQLDQNIWYPDKYIHKGAYCLLQPHLRGVLTTSI